MTDPAAAGAARWPETPWREWTETLATVRLWTQIVGKIKLGLGPRAEHPWDVGLLVTPRGLTTGRLTVHDSDMALDLDFVGHRLVVSQGGSEAFRLALEPRTVADFYAALMASLAGLGIEVHIKTRPFEIPDGIPFDVDVTHASYDAAQATAFVEALGSACRVLEAFQAGFAGEASPVRFFWGSFDVATSRFSGPVEGTFGWWPLNQDFGPAFYAYTSPAPASFRTAAIQPGGAWFDHELGEFILPDDVIRTADDPASQALAFLESTYLAGTAE